jgi:hypothetical protein
MSPTFEEECKNRIYSFLGDQIRDLLPHGLYKCWWNLSDNWSDSHVGSVIGLLQHEWLLLIKYSDLKANGHGAIKK